MLGSPWPTLALLLLRPTFPQWRWDPPLPSPAQPHQVPSPFPYCPPRSLLPSGVETLALETDLLLLSCSWLWSEVGLSTIPSPRAPVETCWSHTVACCYSAARTLWATRLSVITEDPVNVVSMETMLCVLVSCRWRWCSVAKSCPTLWPGELQHAELSCPLLASKKGTHCVGSIHSWAPLWLPGAWSRGAALAHSTARSVSWASERVNRCSSLRHLAYCALLLSTSTAFVPSFPFLAFYFYVDFLLKLIYSVVLNPAVQHGDSVIHTHTLFLLFPLWFITGSCILRPLCCAGGPCSSPSCLW